MAEIKVEPTLNETEIKILGKTYNITTGISTALRFNNPVEVTASSVFKKKKTAIDEIFVIIRWIKQRQLIVQSEDVGGSIAGFTDPELDKTYKEKMAKIAEASIDVALDAYKDFLLKLLEY